MYKQKSIDFEGQPIYVGLDVHLNSWSVTIATDYIIGRTFSISNTSTVLKSSKGDNTYGAMLLRYLQAHYPGGEYYTAYEAGFCGFSVHYELTKIGLANIVVNPADIPTSQKQEVQKTDQIDSLKIVLALRAGQLDGIYVPNLATLNDRMLLRVRTGIVNEIKRYKNQVKSMLNFYGIKYKQEFDGTNYNFTKKFVSWIKDLDLAHDINSPGESTDLITKLMQWTDEEQVHIHVVLHLNKGDDNTRGHLGTELNNKAETILQITKDEFDKDVSAVSSMFIRDKDFEPFAFRINENSLPELVENYQPQPLAKRKAFDYKEVSEEKHREALEAVFSIGDALSYGSLIEQLRSCYTAVGCECGIGKAKKLKQFLTNKRMVVQGDDKLYRYNQDFYY